MKAALISLVVLLIGSLATSGYLLLEHKNSTAIIQGSQNEIKSLKKETLAAFESIIKAEKINLDLKHDLDIANKEVATAASDLTAVKAALKESDETVIAAQSQTAKLKSQLAEAEAGVKALEKKTLKIQQEKDSLRLIAEEQKGALAQREKNLKTLTDKLKSYSTIGLTPGETSTLKQKKPVGMEFSGVIHEKLIRPGKISKPIKNSKKTIPNDNEK